MIVVILIQPLLLEQHFKILYFRLNYSVFHNSIPPSFFLEIMIIIKISTHPCYLFYKCWLIFIGVEAKKKFWKKKKIKMADPKKLKFSTPPILNIASRKMQEFFLGLVEYIDAKGINFGSTYMFVRLSDVSYKTGKYSKQHLRKHMQHSVRAPYVVQHFWIMSFSRWGWKTHFWHRWYSFLRIWIGSNLLYVYA